jgi:hypothetical protein
MHDTNSTLQIILTHFKHYHFENTILKKQKILNFLEYKVLFC